jgi:hypothetical protein
MDNQDSGTALSKVIINGEEFDATEASDLIGVGRQTREMEQKYNTKLDRVWPEYGRASTELAGARKELEEFRSKQSAGTDTAQDRADAKDAAQTLGINPAELEKAGYVKKDQVEELFSKKFEEHETKSRAIKSVLDQADNLENQINGEDGRPKFNKRAVMAYASTFGLGLQEAYDEMHEDSLKAWKDTQLAAEKKKGMKTLHAGGDKQPTDPKITNDNFKTALREALEGGTE